MTKHVLLLIRIVRKSYHLLLLLFQAVERFPLDRFIVAIELFIRWVETQETHDGQGWLPAGGVSENPADAVIPTPRGPLPLSQLPAEAETLNDAEAAAFIERTDRQLRRYRMEGAVPYYKDANGRLLYLKADVERLFELVHGYPRGGFAK